MFVAYGVIIEKYGLYAEFFPALGVCLFLSTRSKTWNNIADHSTRSSNSTVSSTPSTKQW